VIDITFICDGGPRAGYGHVARCIEIGKLISEDHKGIKISFAGEYQNKISKRIATNFGESCLINICEIVSSKVIVIDRLSDPEDMNSWDEMLADKIRKLSSHRVALLSGDIDPGDDSFIRIGYQPGGPQPNPPSLLWGFDFAPVAPGILDSKITTRDKNSILIALGGSSNTSAAEEVLSAVKSMSEFSRVNILMSPANRSDLREISGDIDLNIEFHENLPNIAPLLMQSGIVICSHGNLAYEAMALGAPVCLFAQKDFQKTLAARLAELGLVITAGQAGGKDKNDLVTALHKTYASANRLSSLSRESFDGDGLSRIAKIISLGLLQS